MVCFFIPPHIAKRVAEADASFASGIRVDASLRSERADGVKVRGPIRVYSASNRTAIPGKLVTDNDDMADRVSSHAYAISQALDVSEFPDGVVRYGVGYANAFFNGSYLIFGEGDGQVFGDFTASLDIMAHEFGHALVALGPGLLYSGESGALNEHLADVFGVCVQQWTAQDQTDWRIGEEIMLDGVSAVRDMRNPGSAYDSPILGRDPQPGHMDQYQKIRGDNGGVHINSGIPNRAFALLCEKTGEPSWGRPLAMWRRAMQDLGPRSGFRNLATATCTHSGGLSSAVREAWSEVGISI
ncbi:M4 family metallopeptidase [Streptomyces sp. NEAU-Y11]|uniref:M4 family metallopeptidase n=1 Tax=Streptomyces cucumeris TaxID=2962890 RepID=UPI0020C8FE58|nr:M4 family metallopeptidase [Streptomyces sp. NEAU-Y11]MCP9209514.1 M4 family metallopeptidase [Streptomyces sp. NEAU-Y11]